MAPYAEPSSAGVAVAQSPVMSSDFLRHVENARFDHNHNNIFTSASSQGHHLAGMNTNASSTGGSISRGGGSAFGPLFIDTSMSSQEICDVYSRLQQLPSNQEPALRIHGF